MLQWPYFDSFSRYCIATKSILKINDQSSDVYNSIILFMFYNFKM
jgi:hypothetical protein